MPAPRRITPTARPSVALQQKLEQTAKVGSLRYVQDLQGLMRGLHRAVMADLKPFLHLYAGRRHDGWTGIMDLSQRVMHFVGQVAKKVGRFFRRMATALLSANRDAMTELLGEKPAEPSKGLLEAAEAESVRLVTKAAELYAGQVREVITAATPESTVEELESDLARRGEVSESKAALIARDQTIKLNALLTRDAIVGAGYDKAWWLTCRDDRVRPTHKTNDSLIYALDAPPAETGHPGDDPNCRCQPIPYDGPLAPGERI